ncbi:MAG: S-layer homology domain-containing protein, partial [Eubacteriales bacterium]
DGNAVQICTGYSIQDGEKIIITKDTTYGDNIDGTVELCTRDYIYIEYKGTNLDYCYYQSADGSPTVLELGHNETKNTVSLKTGAVKIVKSTILVNGLEIGTFSGDIYENSPRLTISKSADGSATVFVPKNVTIFTIDGISCSTSGGDTELYIDSYGNISLTKGEIDIIHNSPITLGDITYQGIGDARYLITAVDAGVNSIVALTGSVTATFNKNDKKLDIWKYSYHAKGAGCSVIISRVNLDNIVAAGANTVIDGFEISKASDDMFLPSLGNPGCILSFNVNGGSALNPISTVSGAAIDLSVYTTSRDGFTFDGWYSDAALTNRVTSISLIRSTAVYAKWTEVQTSVSAAETEAPADTEAPEAAMLPFSDVAAGDWFCGDVAYVYENALMKGSDETTFSAYSHATRGMIVSVLYRLAGSPDVTGANPFDDVAAGSYYENAVIWASENGIVNGVGDGKFAPDDDITREQLAAVLYRYAEYAGCDLTASADLTAFTDAGDISGYAAAAISWANANGFISGKGDGILDPLSCAQRCEIAALLHRFCDTFVK